MSKVRVPLIVCGALLHSIAHSGDFRGNVSAQLNYFTQQADIEDSWQVGASLAADVEFYQQLAENVSLTIRPFVRIDQHDDQRTHADFRELIITTTGDSWEFSGGLGQVFWGVTESRNPVDVINQIDNLEGIGSSDKLGQLMLNYQWFSDYGDFQAFLLPHFRERDFAGPEGRPSSGFTVADTSQFESSDTNKSIDIALRWSYSFDSWDLGVSYFDGTSRDPALIPISQTELQPRYRQIQQLGVDALGLFGDLSVKLEIIQRNGDEIDNHAEAVSGIEYTFVGLLSPLQDNNVLSESFCDPDSRNPFKKLMCNDRMDMGLVLEYLWDERGQDATQPFQNDLLTGLRFAFNDERSSDALLGVIQDLDHGSTSVSLEASTRLLESFRLTTEVQLFSNTDDDPFLSSLEDEDFLRVDLAYFF